MTCSVDDEGKDVPSKGMRIPSVPVVCTIDFEHHLISAAPYEITTYELWDEDGHAPLVSYDSDYEFVEFISGLSGNYQLRLVTNQRIYVGYLDL